MSTLEIIFTILFFIVWIFIIAIAINDRLASWWFKVLDNIIKKLKNPIKKKE